MHAKSQHGMIFERVPFPARSLDETELEGCKFRSCDLSGHVITSADFVDCRFETCNLANFVPAHCGMKQVTFVDCKLVGVDFTKCSEFAFAVAFERCNLDYARFTKMPLKATTFDGCSLREASFAEANLTKARFIDCDLDRATFHRTVLTQADFRSATNFAIDPEANRIGKARFSRAGLAGLLGKYDLQIE